MRTRVAGLCALLVVLAVTACDPPSDGWTAPTSAPPTSVPTPGEGELTPGFDQPGDAPVVADDDLTSRQVTALLRVRATDGGGAGRCGPADLAVTIANLDAAAGHRFGRIIVKNRTSDTCTVRGYPGIGARGEWGHTFELAAQQVQPRLEGVAPTTKTVALRTGGKAFADLEWTGELAGAESERASSIALQLARDQSGFLVKAQGAVDPESGGTGEVVALDIGILTTVRVGPFRTE